MKSAKPDFSMGTHEDILQQSLSRWLIFYKSCVKPLYISQEGITLKIGAYYPSVFKQQ